jgi:eukaryotic-like serine/threonine-protein kinase
MSGRPGIPLSTRPCLRVFSTLVPRPPSELRPLTAHDAASSPGADKPEGPDSLDERGAQDDATQLLGQVVAERYRIVELLGMGGMGAVYRADHVHIRKTFALKVLHRELTHHAEAVRRFEREAIAAARIDHPNVATAIDFGRLPSGAFYLVLDYVQGRSLRRVLDDEHRLAEPRVLRVARQIASALVAAHASGIIHRDLKPDNVMLVDSPTETDWVKVLDFGIAKLKTEDVAEEPAITRFGTVFGTPEYMSPEQALGQTVDARTDLYALGIMLYEMLAGRTPFFDAQLVIVLTRQMTEAPAELPQTVSASMRQLVMQLLEKEPDARPANAEQVLGMLDVMVPLTNAGSNEESTTAPAQARTDETATMATGETLYANSNAVRESARQAAENRFDPVPDLSARDRVAASRVPSLPPWVRRHVTIAGRTIPLVFLAMGATILCAGIIGAFGLWAILGRSADTQDRPQSGSVLTGLLGDDPETKQLKSWIEQATNGDPVALSKLEERPDSSRNAAEWAALGAGRARAKQWPAAVIAYHQALSADPKLATSKRLLSDLYQAAIDSKSSAAALETAAQHLGAAGADLIYLALEPSTPGRPSKVDRRKAKSLLESNGLGPHISPSLRVALKLDAARSCVEYRNLLAEVESTGDDRCQRALRRLTYERGCGLLGLLDCYPCLRGSRALANALEAVRSRPSPNFAER